MTYGAAAYGALELGGAPGGATAPASSPVSSALVSQQEHLQRAAGQAVLPLAFEQTLFGSFATMQQMHVANAQAFLSGQQEHSNSITYAFSVAQEHNLLLQAALAGQQESRQHLTATAVMSYATSRNLIAALSGAQEWARALKVPLALQQAHAQQLALLLAIQVDSSALPFVEYLSLACSVAMTLPFTMLFAEQAEFTLAVANLTQGAVSG